MLQCVAQASFVKSVDHDGLGQSATACLLEALAVPSHATLCKYDSQTFRSTVAMPELIQFEHKLKATGMCLVCELFSTFTIAYLARWS